VLSPLLTSLVFVVGILIGGVGIGGVLLVPALKYLGGIPLHVAIPACMLGYILTGTVGAIIYARQGTINWSLAVKVCVGAIPGAYIGAFLLPFVSPFALELTIGILILATGMYAFRSSPVQQETHSSVTGSRLLAVGLITGIGSAMTGTGGPLLLIPILIWCKLPVLTAIGLSQAVQVPISLMATLGNFVHGDIDFSLGLLLAILLATGALIGAKTVHRLPVNSLKKLIAGLLTAVGIMILLRLVV
jgi:uncharacterized membrane protein YfcA